MAQAPAAAPAVAAGGRSRPLKHLRPRLQLLPAAAAPKHRLLPQLPRRCRRPVPNKGDTAWMMVSTLLVILMTVPGLALFYGGLVRSKNMLSVLMQVMVTFSMIVVLWFIYGYSLAFTEGNQFIGGFDRLFMKGIWDNAAGTFANGSDVQQGCVHSRDRVRRLPGHLRRHHLRADRRCLRRAHEVLGGAAVHGPVVHLQLCADRPHGVVLDGSGCLHRQGSGRCDERQGRLIWQKGALDFAGGTVVHINAGVAGLVGAYMVGKRIGYGKESMAPHSLTLTMVGASLLWVGWFGFNAGSATWKPTVSPRWPSSTPSAPRRLPCWPGASVKR
jgi:Amt family ammonium transporter